MSHVIWSSSLLLPIGTFWYIPVLVSLSLVLASYVKFAFIFELCYCFYICTSLCQDEWPSNISHKHYLLYLVSGDVNCSVVTIMVVCLGSRWGKS